jgi:uncharacterized protein YkwD
MAHSGHAAPHIGASILSIFHRAAAVALFLASGGCVITEDGLLLPLPKASLGSGQIKVAASAVPGVAPTRSPGFPAIPSVPPQVNVSLEQNQQPVLNVASPTPVPGHRIAFKPAWTEAQYPGTHDVEALIFQFTNDERVKAGLPPFVANKSLSVSARQHSQEMSLLKYLAHESPTPGNVDMVDRMFQAGYSGFEWYVGENILQLATAGTAPADLARNAVATWMGDEEYRGNILAKDLRSLGVGVYVKDGQLLATQNFGAQDFDVTDASVEEHGDTYVVHVVAQVQPSTKYRFGVASQDSVPQGGASLTLTPGKPFMYDVTMKKDGHLHSVGICMGDKDDGIGWDTIHMLFVDTSLPVEKAFVPYVAFDKLGKPATPGGVVTGAPVAPSIPPSDAAVATPAPAGSADATAAEHELYALMMAYRAEKGLPSIPLSRALTVVAHTHVTDLRNNHPATGACNLHSWSAKGSWTPVCYTPDHAHATEMWSKPSELTGYKDNGYEIAYYETGSGPTARSALDGWMGSPGHNAVIVNEDIWQDTTWNAIGIAINETYAVAWFGKAVDSSK